MLGAGPTEKRGARLLSSFSIALCGVLAAGPPALAASSRTTGAKLPETGLLVHFGCGTGSQTVRLATGGRFVVHGLEKDADKVDRAQKLVRANGLCGRVSIEQWTSSHLPYPDNVVNLLIAKTTGAPSQKEIMRVLRPGGAAKIGSKTLRKPWPKEYDGWTHIRHGPDGNPVSRDTAVALPRNIRWVAPAARNRLPMLSANGRNFYGQVFVRDAFNGLPLWEKRRFAPRVATDDLLYGIEGSSVAVLDAAGGKSLGKFGSADRDTTMLLVDDTLVVATRAEVRAHDARRGRPRWSVRTKSPKCVVAGGGKVFFVVGDPRRGDSCSAVCLDLSTGKEGWRSEAYSWLKKARGCSYGPAAVTAGLRSGANAPGNGLLAFEASSFNDDAPGNALYALSAGDGKQLWSNSYTPGMTHNKQTKAFFIGDGLWIHGGGGGGGKRGRRGRTRGFTLLDPRTGKAAKSVPGGTGHCYPAVATVRFLVGGELNFTDILTGKHERNAITKGECAWGGTFPGWIPANGLLYTYKGCRSHCICYPMVEGCMGLAPSRAQAAARASTSRGTLVKGPGYGKTPPKTPKEQAALEWPCYRHDPWRSGGTPSPVDGKMRPLWTTPAGMPAGRTQTGNRSDNPFAGEWKGNPFVMGPVTAPVVAGGTVIVGLPDAHRLVAMDAATGKVRWSYTANGRIDTPPTCHEGLCIFGTRSGWVYCLLAGKGDLVWRLRAGPEDRRIVAWGQLESAWPVPGSVLAHGGMVYFAAGRSALADGGLQVWAVKARTGRALWRTAVTDYDIRSWYGRIGWDYDPTDLAVFDGKSSLAVSRARIDFRSGKVQVRRGEGAYHRNESGAWLPVGTWAYGTAINRRALKRPLWVSKGRVLYGPPPHGGKTREDGGNVDSGLHAYALPDKCPKAGGREWGSYECLKSFRKNWTARVGKIVAMAVADESLFVADSAGRLFTFSAASGKKLGEQKLPGPPVWDGVAAAYGRLYVSLADGKVVCLGDPAGRTKVPKPVASK